MPPFRSLKRAIEVPGYIAGFHRCSEVGIVCESEITNRFRKSQISEHSEIIVKRPSVNPILNLLDLSWGICAESIPKKIGISIMSAVLPF